MTRREIPNVLTIVRIALAGAFFVMLALADPAGDGGGGSAGLLIAAAVVFAVAAGTDALDGFLARRWDAVSAFGRVMDPFADKVLILGGFIMLAGANFHVPGGADSAGGGAVVITGVASWMPVVVLARELFVTSIRGVYEARGVDFSASLTGKLKMIAQSVGIPVIVVVAALHEPIGIGTASAINTGVAWAVVVITTVSAWPYIRKGIAERARLG
ncbi:MAG: CDP-alcohol phosphatidyltransferase family protein [Phycisphaerales bacterium]